PARSARPGIRAGRGRRPLPGGGAAARPARGLGQRPTDAARLRPPRQEPRRRPRPGGGDARAGARL
ncbi:MAG: hypothetical protein AVDCRST_MAG73-3500, partial [uncultured Thermomicrobiales bacterium]